jgi:hypothetical protein
MPFIGDEYHMRNMLRYVGALGTAAGAALLLAACNPDRVLDVGDPDVVRPGNLTGKGALPALRNGVLGSFQIAYSEEATCRTAGTRGSSSSAACSSTS